MKDFFIQSKTISNDSQEIELLERGITSIQPRIDQKKTHTSLTLDDAINALNDIRSTPGSCEKFNNLINTTDPRSNFNSRKPYTKPGTGTESNKNCVVCGDKGH